MNSKIILPIARFLVSVVGFNEKKHLMRILSECGFYFKEKYHQAGETYNQIWVKN